MNDELETIEETRKSMLEFEHSSGEFLDRSMVLWYSDTDLLTRIDKAGRSVAHVSASRILHKETQSHNPSDPETAARIAEDASRFYSKHPV